MSVLAGIDIGGTKCAIVIGQEQNGHLQLLGKQRYPTQGSSSEMLTSLSDGLSDLLADLGQPDMTAIGIACGGPLDSRAGLILSPPNLPGWERVDVLTPFQERFGVPVGLQNDANAGALAEWRWGAGRGKRNLVFLTMGTGMGAGLILDGHLYSGTNDLAGEAGHIRMAQTGPLGYGKAGSWEGFCSGAGIARLAQSSAKAQLAKGAGPSYCLSREDILKVTAESVASAARQGDPTAIDVFAKAGSMLGRGLAVLVDLLNPQCIVIGSIYARQHDLMEPYMQETLQQEALPGALSVCQVLPAALGEAIGDFAALAVAILTTESTESTEKK